MIFQHLSPLIPELASSQMIVSLDLASIISHNPPLAHPLFVGLLNSENPEHNLPSPFLDILPYLPPTLPTFDLLGRLLRDPTPVGNGLFAVADIVRAEVLGRFTHECINWLDRAEIQEREGLVSDDRFAKGVQNVGVTSLMIFSCIGILLTSYSSAGSTTPSSSSVSSTQPLTRTRRKWRTSA